jgi:hypothetical protein
MAAYIYVYMDTSFTAVGPDICLPGLQRYGYQMPGYLPRTPVTRIPKYPDI